jgi:hypothetical protein
MMDQYPVQQRYRRRLLEALDRFSALARPREDWFLVPTFLTWNNGDEIQIFVRDIGDDQFEYSDLGETHRRLAAFYNLNALPLELMPELDYVRYEDNAFLARTNGNTDLLHAYHRILSVICMMMGAGFKMRSLVEAGRIEP